jgi:hypothetical protein
VNSITVVSPALYVRFSSSMISPHGQRAGNGALLIAACIVAAIRLRGEPIEKTPKIVATIADSVRLARLVLSELQR